MLGALPSNIQHQRHHGRFSAPRCVPRCDLAAITKLPSRTGHLCTADLVRLVPRTSLIRNGRLCAVHPSSHLWISRTGQLRTTQSSVVCWRKEVSHDNRTQSNPEKRSRPIQPRGRAGAAQSLRWRRWHLGTSRTKDQSSGHSLQGF